MLLYFCLDLNVLYFCCRRVQREKRVIHSFLTVHTSSLRNLAKSHLRLKVYAIFLTTDIYDQHSEIVAFACFCGLFDLLLGKVEMNFTTLLNKIKNL